MYAFSTHIYTKERHKTAQISNAREREICKYIEKENG